jgi:hypothetical protein
MIFVSLLGHSQESNISFYSHNLGKIYVYINNQLVERAPFTQVNFTSQKTTKISVKIVFQEHNISPIYQTLKLHKRKPNIFIIYRSGDKIEIAPQRKVKTGHYKPGLRHSKQKVELAYTERLGCISLVTDDQFEESYFKIKRETSEIGKVAFARDFILNHCISVYQLALILNVFKLEESRIEFALFAWAYIYDQNNYSNLAPVFSQKNQITKIMEFVHKNQ